MKSPESSLEQTGDKKIHHSAYVEGILAPDLFLAVHCTVQAVLTVVHVELYH